jgi:two-component SAPR family response regulator
MRAIIVDDELLVAKNLELILNRYCPEVKVAAIAYSAEVAEKLNHGTLDPDSCLPGCGDASW